MTRIGERYMFGRHAAFRTYETSEHTEALVCYGEFRSEQEAKLATKLSLKEQRVTSKEHVKDLNGRVIGNRIVAAPKQEKKAFIIIRTLFCCEGKRTGISGEARFLVCSRPE